MVSGCYCNALQCRKFSISHVTYPMLSVSLMDSVAPYPRVSGPGQEWVGFSILEGDSLVLLRESGEVYQLFMSETKEVCPSSRPPLPPVHPSSHPPLPPIHPSTPPPVDFSPPPSGDNVPRCPTNVPSSRR